MNPLAVLSLISDLYQQVQHLQARVVELEQADGATAEPEE